MFQRLMDAISTQIMELNLYVQNVRMDFNLLQGNAPIPNLKYQNNVFIRLLLINKKDYAKYKIVKLISNGAVYNVIKDLI